MKMEYSLQKDKLDAFLQALSKGRKVFALEPTEGQYHLVGSDGWNPDRHVLGSYRPVEPLKSIVFQPREFLGALGEHTARPELQDRILIGVKSCDLSALAIHDHVFMKTEPVDPFYEEARKKTLIVSCDCTDARNVCFCEAVGEHPYAKDGFDINIAPLADAYLVESGSEQGETLLKTVDDLLQPADKTMLQKRDARRKELADRVRSQAEQKGLKTGMDFQKAIQKSRKTDLWDDFAKDCVECGACNFACCTCHCFLLADGLSKDGDVPARVKLWDSCLYRNFARVAGGANPRAHRAERLYNRFDKKFNFFPTILKTYACDGCGRCVEACAGKIDIRDVLKRAVDEL